MTESKKLVMIFRNSAGKNVSISIDDPKDDLTEEQIKTAMELIVEKNVFKKNDYAFVEAVEAKIVTTDTTEYDLVLQECSFMEIIETLIANVGFPVAVSIYLLIRLEGKLETLTASINELSNNIINLKVTKQQTELVA